MDISLKWIILYFITIYPLGWICFYCISEDLKKPWVKRIVLMIYTIPGINFIPTILTAIMFATMAFITAICMLFGEFTKIWRNAPA